jgi:predicted Zn-dependent protease
MPHRAPSAVLGVLAVLAFLSGLPSHAANTAEPWEGPAFSADPAALVRAAAALPDSGESIDVLLLETVRSFDAAGRETYTQRFVYRFTDGQAHESWSTLEHSWSPWHQERPRLRARVITPDGAEHLLDPATIAENGEAAGSPDMFEDGRVLRAPLPATGPGAIVEQEVTVRETAPFFAGGTVDSAYFQISVPMRRVRLVLEAPAGLPLRWMMRSTPGMPGISPRDESSNGRRRLVFEARGVPAYGEAESGLPPEIPRWTHVSFSTGSSWSDLARRYSDIVDRAIQGSNLSAFLKTAMPASNPAGSQVEMINLLLSRLGREVRYTGIELGEGGVMPRTPAETLKRKFGDCKDKAVLLTALLRSLDIPAYVALLNAGEGEPDVEESLPGLGAFNHTIVMVPGNPAVWIDPTDPYARAGELPVQDQGRLALVASPTATTLVRTPETGSADNREVETREIYLSDLGGARVVETTEYRGAQEQELRAAYADADRDELRAALEEYAGEAYLAQVLTDLDYSDPTDLSQPFRLRLEMDGAARGTTDIRESAVAIFLSSLTERLPEELTAEEAERAEGEGSERRRHDYVFTRPMQVEVRYRIVPPAGFALRPLPDYRARQWGSGKLEESYITGKDGAVEAVIRFDSGKRRISPVEFEALRDGLRQLAAEKPVMVTFDQVGESHLAAGRIREALDEFRRLAAQAPDKALPRTRIARALLAGGLGEAARQEAELATKLEPDFAYAWVTLGWLRQHDDLGRRFGAGFDRAGAIAAYRRAVALQPGSSQQAREARGDLAILLEHDAEGNRYTPGADLAAAIEEYEALGDELEGLGLPHNLEIALMWAQRWEDMKEHLAGREDDEARAALRLVLLAATEGTEAALQDAERSFTDGDARSGALASAGRNLMLMRRYAEAAALFERAGRQSTRAAALLGMAEILRKTRRHEEMGLTSKDPVSAYRRLMTAVDSGGLPGPEALAKLMSKEITRGMNGDERRAFWEGFEDGIESAVREAREDMPVAVAVDLALAAMRETVSGDDAVGYRVVMSPMIAGGASDRSIGYVIAEDGEYRIAAVDRALWLTGGEALRRVERNDLRGARQWLDWAYEELDGGDRSDPFQSSAFLDLWSHHAQGDAEQMRCAAASLLSYESTMSQTLPLLTACRQAAEGPRRTALDRALLAAYLAADRHEDAAETAFRLAETSDSEILYRAQLRSLFGLRRWDDLRRIADARLARLPEDILAQDTIAELALRQGDFDAAERIYQRILGTGRAPADHYNTAAWVALVRGRTDEQVLELAQRAASLSEYQDYGILHTLAAVYAEQGKTAEAYRVILQALELKKEPDADDLYVFGRLAEHYGLPDAARRYYEKAGVEGEEDDDNPMDTIHLVRKRLEALGKPPDPKQVATRR